MTTALAIAVALGHRFGVDFAAVDRGDASTAAAAPLLLLVAAAIAAFPFAGYLVARASSTGSVLEPAASRGARHPGLAGAARPRGAGRRRVRDRARPHRLRPRLRGRLDRHDALSAARARAGAESCRSVGVARDEPAALISSPVLALCGRGAGLIARPRYAVAAFAAGWCLATSSWNLRSSSCAAGERFRGTSTWITTWSAPRPRPSMRGAPLPLTVITSPGCVPAGIVDVDRRVVRQVDLDRAAERRVGEGDGRARDEVEAVALEALVRGELDVDVEIAGRRRPGRRACPGPARGAAGRRRCRRESDDDLARLLDRARSRCRWRTAS